MGVIMNTMTRGLVVSVLLGVIVVLVASCGGSRAVATKTAYDFQVRDIKGGVIDLTEYKGEKVALFVNTATECGGNPTVQID